MAEYHYDGNGYSDDESGRTPDQKRGSGFWKGVLTGVICTLVVCLLALAGFVAVNGIRYYLYIQNTDQKDSSVVPEADSSEECGSQATGSDENGAQGSAIGGQSDSLTAEDMQEILYKMEEIQWYVDEYYLFDYDAEDVKDHIFYGMLDGLGDPYTYYYNTEDFNALEEMYSGEYYGIGILISQNMETGEVEILRVYDGPAKEAGIRKGDILIRVEEMIVQQEDVNNVAARVRGESGSTVEVEIYRPSTDEYLEMDVERRRVITENVEYTMLDDAIGYIMLDQFEGQGAKQMKAALKALEQQGMEGLVLDLRDNPGGDLQVLLDIADIFLPRGVVLTIEEADGTTTPYYSGSQQFKKPLVVLVNENSASASEAFSGAVKDHKAGVLVGTQTFGKGIVQSIITLNDGQSAVKLTTAHYYTPNGSCIHNIGITPDVVVERDDSGTDNQLEAAVDVLKDLMGS